MMASCHENHSFIATTSDSDRDLLKLLRSHSAELRNYLHV
jgi:hypothetical protein